MARPKFSSAMSMGIRWNCLLHRESKFEARIAVRIRILHHVRSEPTHVAIAERIIRSGFVPSCGVVVSRIEVTVISRLGRGFLQKQQGAGRIADAARRNALM